MTARPSVYGRLPWLIIAVFVAGLVVLASGMAVGSTVVIVIGAVLAVTAAACGVILPRRGVSGPISFTQEWPPTTVGPRGRHSAGLTFDTEPNAPPRPPPALVEEIHSRDAPHGPDRERSFAQYVNLGPHELLHQIEGKAYVELDDAEEQVPAAEPEDHPTAEQHRTERPRDSRSG
jgi:hypothetical protein